MKYPLRTRYRPSASVFTGPSDYPLYRPGLQLSFAPDPGTGSRVQRARQLLDGAGFPDPESAVQQLPLPSGRWLALPPRGHPDATWSAALPWDSPTWVPLDEPVQNPLLAALVLGLCGPALYHPGRPLLWTENRLRRVLQLWSPPSPPPRP